MNKLWWKLKSLLKFSKQQLKRRMKNWKPFHVTQLINNSQDSFNFFHLFRRNEYSDFINSALNLNPSRNWSFWFKIWTMICRLSLQNLLHSTIEPLPEYKTQSLKKSRFILSHYGVFKGCWDWLILVSTFYVAFVVPYNAAFVQTDRLTLASDVTIEALFIVGEWAADSTFLGSINKLNFSRCPFQILFLTSERRLFRARAR